MTTTILRDPADAYVAQDRPSDNFADAVKLRLSVAHQAFLFFGGGPRPGVFVVSAVLELTTRQAWSGSTTLTVAPVVETWKESAITWNRRPDVGSGAISRALSNLDANEVIAVDVTAMVRAGFLGSAFRGFRLAASGATERNLHSAEAGERNLRPRLVITFSSAPTQAVDLSPADGSIISVSHPVLRWTHYDIDGDGQSAFRVETDAGFDSDWIPGTEPELDLAETAFGGVAVGDSFSWRVTTRDETGQESEPSDWAQVSRVAKGTLEINAPTSQVEESTPEITTTLTGQVQATISYLLEEQAGDGTWVERWAKPRHRAPAASGEEYTFEIPALVDSTDVRFGRVLPPPIRRKNTPYRLTVRSWDDVTGRIHTPGDPLYVEEQVTFEWVDAVDDPTSPSGLQATQEENAPGTHGPGPGAHLAWTRAAVPDFWSLHVDDELVVDQVPATDWQDVGTAYEVTYYGAQPGVELTYEVSAVEQS